MSDALKTYYKWVEEQDSYDPESWDMMIAMAQEIESLRDDIDRAGWIAARVGQLLAGTDRVNYNRAVKRATDEALEQK